MTTERIQFKALRPNRGHCWIAKRGEDVIGSFGWHFLPANAGGFFDRNHRPASVRAFVHIGESKEETVIGTATYAKQAEKIARKWLRDNNVREMFK